MPPVAEARHRGMGRPTRCAGGSTHGGSAMTFHLPAGRPAGEPADVVSALAVDDWDFADAPSDNTVHALHPYPAKFIPQLPRRLIDALSAPGALVLDPFSGGGTTAVEALVAGRDFHGIDANPLAILIGRMKTTVLDASSVAACEDLATRVRLDPQRPTVDRWVPVIPNVDKWYTREIFDLLVALRHDVMGVEDEPARELALLVFANVAAKASHQESETRYVSKPRALEPAAVLGQFAMELRRATSLASMARYPDGVAASFFDGDARDAALYPSEAALAVTSPPYPNSFDYHLYHRFRLFWLGPGPLGLRSKEIGSHLKHQAEKDPAASYISDMRVVLENVRRSLAAGGYFALVVGDGIYKGVPFKTSAHLSNVALDLGYEVAAVITRQLPVHRRSVTSAGRRLQQEEVLLLRKPSIMVLHPPNYQLFPYEKVLARRETEVLLAPHHGTRSGTRAASAARAAFSHSYERDGQVQKTYQYYAEGSPARGSRNKNSTYLTHGLHRYKGKFYPQLAKALLNMSGPERVNRVVDPFGGSGTVALEANLLGLDALSLDCNPIAASVARAKSDILHLERDAARGYLARLISASQPSRRTPGSFTQFEPDVLAELESWFPVPVLSKLDHLLTSVRSHSDERLVNLGEALVSDLIRDVSQQDPRDLRIRRRAEPIEDAPVLELFGTRVSMLLGRLEDYWTHAQPNLPKPGNSVVVLGDSGDPGAYPSVRAQAVVSSPPYAAALPYIDTDRLSLAAVYGYTGQARKALETTMIGSREVSLRERRAIEFLLEQSPDTLMLPDSTLTFLMSYLQAVRLDDKAGFRRQQGPAVLTRYFQAMSLVLSNLAEHLDPGSDVWLILGDSRSVIGGVNWRIPTVDEVYAIGKHSGLDMVETIPITVTREDVIHARNTIVDNKILHLRTPG